MLKAVCIFVLFICIGTMIYSITNAILVYKKNKAKDETTRKIFLAEIEKEQRAKSENKTDSSLKQPFQTIKPKKEIDYDHPEEDPAPEQEYHLKDFFK